MDEDVLDWTRKALLEGHESEKKYHDEMVAALQSADQAYLWSCPVNTEHLLV